MNAILFIIPMLIWGSTWYIIKFQLGVVDPLVSVVYRFALAGLIMIVFAAWRRYDLKFSLRDHAYMLLQGITLFGHPQIIALKKNAVFRYIGNVDSECRLIEHVAKRNVHSAFGCIANSHILADLGKPFPIFIPVVLIHTIIVGDDKVGECIAIHVNRTRCQRPLRT